MTLELEAGGRPQLVVEQSSLAVSLYLQIHLAALIKAYLLGPHYCLLPSKRYTCVSFRPSSLH